MPDRSEAGTCPKSEVDKAPPAELLVQAHTSDSESSCSLTSQLAAEVEKALQLPHLSRLIKLTTASLAQIIMTVCYGVLCPASDERRLIVAFCVLVGSVIAVVGVMDCVTSMLAPAHARAVRRAPPVVEAHFGFLAMILVWTVFFSFADYCICDDFDVCDVVFPFSEMQGCLDLGGTPRTINECQHLPAEQRSEYEVRRESFGKLAGMLRSAATLAEPQGLAGADEKSLLQSWKETKFRVKEAVFDMLRSCDLGHLIREAPAVCVEPGDDADDAGGAAASGPPRRSAAKGKAKAQAKPQPKIWGKRPAPAEEKGLQQRPQRAKRKGPPVSAAGPIQSLLKTLGRFKDEEDARSRGGAPRPKAKAATTRNGADTEVELTSGPAKGWSVKVAPAGGGSLYRQPEAKRWLTSLIVKARLEAAGESPAVFAALKAQSSAMQKDVTQRSRARGRSDAVGGAGAKHSGQAGSGQKPQQDR
ncbi:unnamed protein product [Prorocentrum cordatum]|uniref:Uncharacterized protein n=1 Tax=Prorocentrum cordatum TaxID=2364126 RepID=A0ABN9YGX9_9DINO|nr:unnamed protein product [Polarella glacialis]